MATFSPSSAAPVPARVRLLPSTRTMGRDAAYLLTGLPAGVVTFSVLISGLAGAAALALTLLGIPVLLATLYAARAMGDLERRRAGWVLGAPVARADRPWRGGPWVRFKAALTDAGAWRDTAWGLVLLPIGTLGFSVVVSLWTSVVALITSPLWAWSVPDDEGTSGWVVDQLNSHALGASAGRVALGIVLIPVAAWLSRGLAAASGRAAQALLRH